LVMDRLNNRPRKCLGFMSPFEVFFNQSVAFQS
jgi:IS30 family transposase